MSTSYSTSDAEAGAAHNAHGNGNGNGGSNGENGGGRPDLPEIEINAIELFVRLARLFGISKSIGEIYGILFISPTPVPLDSIRSKLNMSSGSTSQGLRLLRTVGAVRVTYVPGDRRDHYVAETALRKIMGGFLREKIVPALVVHEERLERLSELLSEIPENERMRVESRIRILESWRRQARAMLPLMINGLEETEK